MPNQPYKPRIFISYSHADEPEKPAEGEVKWLSFVTGYLRPAERHGAVELWIDCLIPGGADWEREIADKLRACDIFILLVSPDSLSSNYVLKSEIPIIRERQDRGDAVHFYPLLLKPTPDVALDLVRDKNLRPRDAKPFSGYSLNERYGHMNEAANEILRIALAFAQGKAGAGVARTEAITSLEQEFTLTNVPIDVPRHFLGRDNELAAIGAALKPDEGRVAITALHGMRGVGKTTLAAAYAERHRNDYRATWWIRAQTDSTIRADLVSLGVRLGWVGADEKEEPAFVKVRDRLRHEGDGLLLIYDNAIDPTNARPYLQSRGAARALVTSNSPVWRGVATLVEIRVWPRQVGADYLIARAGRSEERLDAEALSQTLGGLTLAHEQAATYCERTGVSLAEYRKRFEAAPTGLLDAAKDASADYYGGLTVAKAFALAIDEAAKIHPAAEPLIVHAALLAPEPIPLFLFSEGREKFGDPLASQLADDGLDEAVAALRAFALVDREMIPDEYDPAIVTETIRLHRLVRAVAASRLRGKGAEAAWRVLVDAMAAVYPRTVYYDPTAWPRARRLDALALDLVAGPRDRPSGAEVSVSYLLDRLASYRRGALADYAAGRPLLERAVAIREQALGEEHLDTAQSLSNLAGLLQDQGDLAGARPFYERALAITEKALGSEHPFTATNLSNLAVLLQAQGDLASARPLKERALAIREAALGPEHRDTAISLNNLALLLQAQGDLDGARPLFERALAILKKVLGPEHPNTNRARSNLADLRLAQSASSEALALSESALAAHDKALGAEHPWTKSSARVTADALDALGRADEAAALRAKYELDGSASA